MTTSAVMAPTPALQRSWRSDSLTTWANAVTGVRTVAAVAVGLVALVEHSATLLVVAYAVYWVGDILDGWLARRLNQETRLGAVLDIIGDRASCSVLVCGLVTLQPHLWPALAVFLVQFMLVDCTLSLSFLHWPLLSPNYFYLVDRTVYRWNWSRPAKAVNTAGVVLAVATGSLPLASAVATVQLLVKAESSRRMLHLLARTG